MKATKQDRHLEKLREILEPLMDYCISEGLQLVVKTQDPDDDNSDITLVVCLHGDPKIINDCHNLVQAFIKNNLGHFTQ